MAISDLSDYGFLLSQLGVDVTDAADNQLVNSSGWPNLKIEYTASVTLGGGATHTYTHNLGYPPLVLIEVTDDVAVGTGKTFQAFAAGSVTNTTFSITDPSIFQTGCKVRYYVYRLPLNVAFKAKIYNLSTASAAGKDLNVGLKVMKPGKKMDSADLRDYNYHSSTRSPMIHTVATGLATANNVSGFNEFSWTNDLGYVPIFFAFTGGTNQATWTPKIGLEQSTPRLFVDPVGNLTMRTSPTSSAAQYVSLVVFKDPFAVGTTTNVSM